MMVAAPSILDPAGPGARLIESLWWPMLWISTAVFVIVCVFLLRAMARGRRDGYESLDRREPRWGEPFIAIAGVFIPALILAGVYVYSLRQMDVLSDIGDDASYEIEVVARNWWWEARYPNGAVTANEIHIPAGEPVRLKLTAADVIHSFWVPELQAKTDHVPGHDNYMWIEADEPGRYRGQCAEFCGLQHANMIFYVVADAPDVFDEWVANEAADADAVGTPGEQLFLDASCAGCHTVRGTTADGDLGPDLTHLATRETIAGVVANSRENLRAFSADPHTFKPGVSMPPTELSPDELDAVVDYLMELD
ncbi:MAG: cytochrome c oxidase subunit II [Actinobacteria bacterium]|nr:cytochrome c oxidase subunit II [Actinomycetota bacterium]